VRCLLSRAKENNGGGDDSSDGSNYNDVDDDDDGDDDDDDGDDGDDGDDDDDDGDDDDGDDDDDDDDGDDDDRNEFDGRMWTSARCRDGRVCVSAEVVVAPTAVHLAAVKAVLRADIGVAAQNCWKAAKGAFTGEIRCNHNHDRLRFLSGASHARSLDAARI
jgi:hypothetical protein